MLKPASQIHTDLAHVPAAARVSRVARGCKDGLSRVLRVIGQESALVSTNQHLSALVNTGQQYAQLDDRPYHR